MSMFTNAEINYFGSQQLGRLATLGQDGMPHVVPVAYRYTSRPTPLTSAGTTSPSARSFATCSEQAWRRWWSTTSCGRGGPAPSGPRRRRHTGHGRQGDP
jgi:hypothetical protein